MSESSSRHPSAVVSVRLAEPTDAPRIAPLFDAYRQFYAEPADAGLALRFIADRLARQQSEILLAEALVVAEHDAGSDASSGAGPVAASTSLIGFCQLYPSFCSVEAAPIFVLYDLFVDPAVRRSGAGRALLLAAAELARLRGKARMDLSTAHDNLAAQALYESLGWRRDTQFRVYSLALG